MYQCWAVARSRASKADAEAFTGVRHQRTSKTNTVPVTVAADHARGKKNFGRQSQAFMRNGTRLSWRYDANLKNRQRLRLLVADSVGASSSRILRWMNSRGLSFVGDFGFASWTEFVDSLCEAGLSATVLADPFDLSRLN